MVILFHTKISVVLLISWIIVIMVMATSYCIYMLPITNYIYNVIKCWVISYDFLIRYKLNTYIYTIISNVWYNVYRFLCKYKCVKATINTWPCSFYLMMNLWYGLLLKCFHVPEKKTWKRTKKTWWRSCFDCKLFKLLCENWKRLIWNIYKISTLSMF